MEQSRAEQNSRHGEFALEGGLESVLGVAVHCLGLYPVPPVTKTLLLKNFH
jgi:hypothetical protein